MYYMHVGVCVNDMFSMIQHSHLRLLLTYI